MVQVHMPIARIQKVAQIAEVIAGSDEEQLHRCAADCGLACAFHGEPVTAAIWYIGGQRCRHGGEREKKVTSGVELG